MSLPKSLSDIEQLLSDSIPCKIRAKRGCATHPRSIAERVNLFPYHYSQCHYFHGSILVSPEILYISKMLWSRLEEPRSVKE